MRLSPLLLALTLAGCVTLSPAVEVVTDTGDWPATATCVAPAAASAFAADILSRVNAERTASGFAPVRADARVTRAAQKHACDVAAMGKLSHAGSDGSSLTRRLGREGVLGVAAIENAGLGYPTPAGTMAGWLASPGHRTNLFNPGMRRLGVGIADTANGQRVWILVMVQ